MCSPTGTRNAFSCSENGEDEEEEVEESSDDEESGSDESGSGTDDENQKAKGVQGLIEIENPNRAVKKAAQKVTTASLEVTPELSRSDQKQLEKQRAREHYQKLHAEGKTKQARADLARLAIIKQHRAEAAARREADKKGNASRPHSPFFLSLG